MHGLRTTSANEVRAALLEKREIALIDVGEEAIFAAAHPLFAACLPFSRLELEVYDRIPCRSTAIVVYDSSGHRAGEAIWRLAAFGYRNCTALEGGLEGWRTSGGEIFQDVNSPSKAFGELVEAWKHTPSLTAPVVQALLGSGTEIAVLDARPFGEYHAMSIPGGTDLPGGELVHRVRDLVPDDRTTIIVNCAGRTRSIIGTQSLLNAGVPNPIFALRNGTIGWLLAGQALEHGQIREAPPARRGYRSAFADAARGLADRAGVRRLAIESLAALGEQETRTVYCFDVRTADEYVRGHLPGFRWAPGGQLVQETDAYAPVRGARIVLYDGEGTRADMAASWLAQMGWETYVLDVGGDRLETAVGPWRPALPAVPLVDTISPDALARRSDCLVVDLGSSRSHLRGHVPGAWFAVRSQIQEFPEAGPIVLASEDGVLATFAAADIRSQTDRPVLVLEGGTDGWSKAGLPLEAGLERLLTPVIDRYRRPYEGTDSPAEAMQAYLDWEFGLVAQLERDGTHGFFVI